ncbi:hypothetical protein [Rhizobium sp. LC145]|uniref:hypothetical protein n=1 Tax=Rhizobium sp. LC145 TaxID=1120688 RepID=UPI00062A1EC1|nr:hypothetical protein [Rhizobium sp. LC145]KKX24497.1 hypothetical protein YH62_27325 [Rhizobium sp. LC145]
MFEHAASIEPIWQERTHALKGLPGIVDIRNLGLLAGIELSEDAATGKAMAKKVYDYCFEQGVLIRPVAIQSSFLRRLSSPRQKSTRCFRRSPMA